MFLKFINNITIIIIIIIIILVISTTHKGARTYNPESKCCDLLNEPARSPHVPHSSDKITSRPQKISLLVTCTGFRLGPICCTYYVNIRKYILSISSISPTCFISPRGQITAQSFNPPLSGLVKILTYISILLSPELQSAPAGYRTSLRGCPTVKSN